MGRNSTAEQGEEFHSGAPSAPISAIEYIDPNAEDNNATEQMVDRLFAPAPATPNPHTPNPFDRKPLTNVVSPLDPPPTAKMGSPRLSNHPFGRHADSPRAGEPALPPVKPPANSRQRQRNSKLWNKRKKNGSMTIDVGASPNGGASPGRLSGSSNPPDSANSAAAGGTTTTTRWGFTHTETTQATGEMLQHHPVASTKPYHPPSNRCTICCVSCIALTMGLLLIFVGTVALVQTERLIAATTKVEECEKRCDDKLVAVINRIKGVEAHVITHQNTLSNHSRRLLTTEQMVISDPVCNCTTEEARKAPIQAVTTNATAAASSTQQSTQQQTTTPHPVTSTSTASTEVASTTTIELPVEWSIICPYGTLISEMNSTGHGKCVSVAQDTVLQRRIEQMEFYTNTSLEAMKRQIEDQGVLINTLFNVTNNTTSIMRTVAREMDELREHNNSTADRLNKSHTKLHALIEATSRNASVTNESLVQTQKTLADVACNVTALQVRMGNLTSTAAQLREAISANNVSVASTFSQHAAVMTTMGAAITTAQNDVATLSTTVEGLDAENRLSCLEGFHAASCPPFPDFGPMGAPSHPNKLNHTKA